MQSHLKFSKIEKMQALKMGYFYWLHVKNHLYTELSLGYPKDAKFYLDSKASFIELFFCKNFLRQKTCVGDGGELERARAG